MAPEIDIPVIALDINASRVRAVSGPATEAPANMALESKHADLPLALSLQGPAPEVGRAGLALSRRLPHLACLNFLAALGSTRQWRYDRCRLDAEQALNLVLERLRPVCAPGRGLVLALPSYLHPGQVDLVVAAMRAAGFPLLGSVAAPLATALSSYTERPWFGTVIVVDADTHALTLTTLLVGDGQAQQVDTRVLPHLNVRVWKDRLLDAVADRCIRQSRRDPRESAAAEQGLYDSLEEALDACRQGRQVDLVIQAPHWYQNLVLQPEEFIRFCAPLHRPVVEAFEAILAATRADQAPRMVLMTEEAGRLPGLVAVLQKCFNDHAPAEDSSLPPDYGIDLLRETAGDTSLVMVLAPDAVARAAHALAPRFLRQELPAGHLDNRAPVPPPQSVQAGSPRLHFRGQDFLLNRPSFVLGRQPTCDLVFDSEAYPAVSAWHCEIICDHRTYILRDRSRHGTLVNEERITKPVPLRAGDWIRLGPDGPRLRFLGQAGDPRRLMTTA
jgi:hypothetical protein